MRVCGIVTILSLKGRPISLQALERGLGTLHHRGPDGQKTWVSPDYQVGLGHARLSVIDLKTGDQPIANEDESAWIIANGEFYDYERVQTELERCGHRLRTRSDSEIALHLYEDLGTRSLHRLRGEFAFILWDDRARKLVAVRDRFGVKPLFYAVHDGALYLASEIKALFAAGVPASWDAEAVYYSLGFRPPGRTQFSGVHAVPPGHFLTADASGIFLTQYWDITYPPLEDMPPVLSDGEYIEGFRSVLDEAVRLRLRADVPVACYLSGGIDSCAVLGLAARHRSEPMRAFTLRFDHEGYDEGEVAREMARKTGAEWVPVPVDQADLADHFSDAIHFAESHCINGHFVAKYLLSRAARDAGFKVVLTGEGADEVLAGYAHFREDELRYGDAGPDATEIERLLGELEAANEASSGLLMASDRNSDFAALKDVLGFIPTMYWPVLSRLKRLAPLLDQEYFAPFKDVDHASVLLSHVDAKRQLTGRAPVHQSLYLWAKTVLPNYILVLLGDRMEMAHSIEGRLPFLDHEVAEFLFTTPVDLKIRGRSEKHILRQATRDMLTDAVYRRQKHPFLSPPATADMTSPMNTLIQDTLHGDAVADVPFLNAPAVRGLADRLETMTPTARRAIDADLMILTSLVMLHERFVQPHANSP